MELDELKNRWTELDKQVQTNKVLNETIIMKMVQGKIEKTIDKLLRSEIIATIIVILGLSFVVYSIEKYHEHMKLYWNLLMILGGVICFIAIFCEIYKVSLLLKIDLSKVVKTNIIYVNKYQIQIKREFFSVIYFILPVVFILDILMYADENASFSKWIFLICVFIFGAFIIWFSKKKYKKTHESILASLDEINELSEENEKL